MRTATPERPWSMFLKIPRLEIGLEVAEGDVEAWLVESREWMARGFVGLEKQEEM